jgi:hypothetical protein
MALMGDCRLCSLVCCHVSSAQILELSHWLPLDASAERRQAEMGFPDWTEVLRKCSLTAEEGQNCNLLSRSAMKHSPKEFPQTSERLSRPNLGILFFCVNVSR